MRGLFITFEGPDGAGKTTQVKAFAEALAQRGHDVLVTREPGGTAISDKIRGLILDPSHREMDDVTEALLYAASRAQHVREKVLPALARGTIVVCDRFVDASLAYQGFGLGLPVHKIKEINEFATGGLVPDRTYLLDIPVAAGRARLQARAGLDRIEQKEAAYHERVREGFHTLAKEHPARIRVIDATQSVEAVAQEVLADFLRWLPSIT
ncbi:dTMP kinase [Brevibacillus sp. SYP-B805]|uniref:dTMP kinase n=1 Tax=Brevibacillus sp. SYP-B805 TaxID=1578199 RepID=UPI0013EB8E40|nr:dTMP kinase [Brevibacillus sp. SYP-B805]NGQ96505.1 dTMP kinase [Brevibacillus sp. SYP-B805]